MKKKWKKILLWSLSVIVLLGVGGLFAANYAVDKLMNSMADGFDLESDDTANAGQGNGTVSDVPVATDDSDPAKTAEPAATPAATPAVPASQDQGGNNGKDAVPTTEAPTTTPSKEQTGTSKDGYTAQVSTDKAKDIKENVTVKDKADVASIVLGQLSVSDIKSLQELAKGGLTIEEKREARSIILGKVSEEQYNELSQIAKKYGVSQGKTRDQVITEEKEVTGNE